MSAQPAIPSADPFESILKGMRTPGKRSKIEPFNLVNPLSKKSAGPPGTVDS
jgi:hypothetical protein